MGIVIPFPSNRARTSKCVADTSGMVSNFNTGMQKVVDSKEEIRTYQIVFRDYYTPECEGGRWAGIPTKDSNQHIHLNASSETEAYEKFMETHGQGTYVVPKVIEINAL